MKDWFMELDSRERLLLIGAGSFLALVLVFLLAIEPLYAKTAALEERIKARQADLTYIQRGAQQILASGQTPSDSGSGSGAGARPLVVLVDQTARTSQLGDKLSQNQPGADGKSIKVRFDNAPFDAMIPWIATLGSRHNIEVDAANIERNPGPGLVDVSLTLKR